MASGNGVNHRVDSIALSGSTVCAGGRFTIAGDEEAIGIAQWDGRSWLNLGDGVDGAVYAIGVHENDIYALGDFTMAGGFPANHIAKWDGSIWTPLGAGFTRGGSSANDDFAVAIWRDKLFAGSERTILSAGGKPIHGIASAFLNAIPPLEVVNGVALIYFRDPNVWPESWHRIERSTDLDTWDQIGLEYAGPTGGIDFRDNHAPPEKAFYRAVLVTEQ